jgi:protein phosphatase
MDPNRMNINRQNKINPKSQFVSTFNNSGKMMKYSNVPGSLNNTASSSFQNQKSQNIINNSNNINYAQQNQNQENFMQGTNRHNASANINNNRKMQEKYLEKETTEPFIVDCNGDKPLPRFGHSLVMITPVKICLFGGAVGETRRINYSNDTYIYNIMTKIWMKLNINSNTGLVPSERAAHAAASNDNLQMVIYGGSNSTGLADDKLWMLHLSEQNEGIWTEIKVVGQTPGPRYGHSLAYMNPFFVLFGGNFNPNLTNEVWIINTKSNQCQWEKINFGNNNIIPSARLYHTCGICPSGNCQGMMIVFGGRDSNEKPLNDIWGLTRHRDGNWSWSKAELKDQYEMKPRYNHSMVFYNGLMIILGGRGYHSSNGNNILPIEVFNTETNDGFDFPGITMNRQTSFVYDKNIFLLGGFDSKSQQRPLGNLFRIPLEKLFERNIILKDIFINKNDYIHKINANKNKNINANKQKMQFKLTQDVVIGSGGIIQEGEEEQLIEDPSSYHKISLHKLTEENKRIGESTQNQNINLLLHNKHQYDEDLIEKFIQTLLRPFDWYDPKMEEIHSNLPFNDEEIQKLIEEVKPILEKDHSLIKIRSPCKIFGNLYGIYNDLMRYFESYGNPSDDNQMGDISVMQYIFLGDFCDRGYNSLEIILLLFALKIKFPQFIYIIRGHHEDKNINAEYGLGQECIDRLSDDIRDPLSIFANINKAFDLLPFGVLVDNNILMVHGGIGSSINSLDDIDCIKRPIEVVQNVSNNEQLKVIDLLWSEYCDEIDNIDANIERDKFKKGFIVKYGKNRLNKFLDENKINLLITAHQFVKGGFTTFNNDRLLIVFSATNYMNKFGNVGGMITIAKKNANKRMNIIPKLITLNNYKEDTYRRNKSPSPIRINK